VTRGLPVLEPGEDVKLNETASKLQ
jgi:hypothetical protein